MDKTVMNKRIQIRCTEEERAEFQAMAKVRGLDSSEFFRLMLSICKGEQKKESLSVDINQGIDKVIKELELLKIK